MTAPDPLARFAVVLTHNRPDLLAKCVAAIGPQVDLTIVIDNASDPPVDLADIADEGWRTILLHVPDQPPNLARLWNVGLDTATTLRAGAPGPWHVAFLCDDAIVGAGWFTAVADTIRTHGAAAGSTHAISRVASPLVKTAPDSDIYNRMCGWAFVVSAEKGWRANESMHWWWLDTDADFSARVSGGMVIAPGPVVVNERPNDFTYSVPGLAEQAGRDREAFAAKWGSAPW